MKVTKDLMQNDIDEMWTKAYVRKPSSNSYIKKSIAELLGKDFKTIQGRTYSSKEMNEFQNALYLIRETDKLLFPNGEQYLASIIYDEYDQTKGPAGVIEIIRQYVNWVDTR